MVKFAFENEKNHTAGSEKKGRAAAQRPTAGRWAVGLGKQSLDATPPSSNPGCGGGRGRGRRAGRRPAKLLRVATAAAGRTLCQSIDHARALQVLPELLLLRLRVLRLVEQSAPYTTAADTHRQRAALRPTAGVAATGKRER